MDRWSAAEGIFYVAILFLTGRDIIFPAMILMPAIGYFTERYEKQKKSHLQANTSLYGPSRIAEKNKNKK
jgi:hypothetical protein